MYKTISILVISAALLTVFLCSCNSETKTEETTDNSEKIIAAIDKSSPITKGNLITKTETSADGKINIKYYDSNDNLVENFVWDEDEKISHSVMKYSASDKLLTKEELTPDGKTNSVESYQYDTQENIVGKTVNEFEEGMLKKSTVFDADNKMTSYSLSFYNDADLLSKVERYNESEELEEYYMYEYNTDGLSVKYSAFKNNGELEKYTTFEYDDNGKMISERYFDSLNTLVSYNLYEYYDSGNMKSAAKYNAEGGITDIDYFEDVS